MENCAACHQIDGSGVPGPYPPLDGNEMVLDQDPSRLIEITLYGVNDFHSFDDVLEDGEVAGVLSYIRNAWTNTASFVTTEQIQDLRR